MTWQHRQGVAVWCRTYGPLKLHADTMGVAMAGPARLPDQNATKKKLAWRSK